MNHSGRQHHQHHPGADRAVRPPCLRRGGRRRRRPTLLGGASRGEPGDLRIGCRCQHRGGDPAHGRRASRPGTSLPDRLDLPVVVASSRLDPKKNHFTIVEAFAQDAELRQMANLVILTGALDDPLRSDEGVSAGELEVLRPIRDLIGSAGLEGSVAAFALPGPGSARRRLPLPGRAAIGVLPHGALRAVRARPAGGRCGRVCRWWSPATVVLRRAWWKATPSTGCWSILPTPPRWRPASSGRSAPSGTIWPPRAASGCSTATPGTGRQRGIWPPSSGPWPTTSVTLLPIPDGSKSPSADDGFEASDLARLYLG